MLGGDAGACGGRHIEKLTVSPIPIKLARLLVLFAQTIVIDKGINVSGSDKQVLPTVVVEINKSRAPFHVAGLDREAGARRHIAERAVTQVAIEGIGVTRKIGFEDVQVAIAIIIGGRRSHTGLLAPGLINSQSRSQPYFFKS